MESQTEHLFPQAPAPHSSPPAGHLPLDVPPPRKTQLGYKGDSLSFLPKPAALPDCPALDRDSPFPGIQLQKGEAIPFFFFFFFFLSSPWGLNHWTNREVPRPFFILASLSLSQDPVSLILPFRCPFLSILTAITIVFIQPPIDEFCLSFSVLTCTITFQINHNLIFHKNLDIWLLKENNNNNYYY